MKEEVNYILATQKQPNKRCHYSSLIGLWAISVGKKTTYTQQSRLLQTELTHFVRIHVFLWLDKQSVRHLKSLENFLSAVRIFALKRAVQWNVGDSLEQRPIKPTSKWRLMNSRVTMAGKLTFLWKIKIRYNRLLLHIRGLLIYGFDLFQPLFQARCVYNSLEFHW